MHPWLRFVSPVNRPSTATQGWGRPRPASVGGQHRGLDLSAKVGDPVYAVGDGVVEFARTDPESTAGLWVGIRHEDHLLTRYLHLSRVLVTVGQVVRAGQMIGQAGTTGFSEGPHLHFDAILGKDRLAEYVQLFGMPQGGFGPASDFGYKVPAEPLIPVDTYSQAGVVADARAYGIPLYAEVARGPSPKGVAGAIAAVAGLSALVAAGVFLYRTTRQAYV